MLPASNRGAGMNVGFPDPCLTPVGPAVVAVPYPNLAMNAMAAPFSPNVLLTMLPALNLGSVIPMTSGDEPGVAHPTIKGPATFTMGNPKVLVNGLPGIDLTSPATGNSMNAALCIQAVPSATNVFFTYFPYVTSGEARRLGASLPRDGSAVTSSSLAGGVGYVRVAFFSADVAARVFTAVRELSAGGARGFVLDLRGNPGGELAAALELAGDFLERGSLLLTLRDEDGDETEYFSEGSAPYRQPLCVLVDRATASAAEVFAGCLKAHGRALLVGETTYGKGSGFALVRGRDGSLRRATAVFTLPNGEAVEARGVVPDATLLPSEDPVAHAAKLLEHVG